MTTSANQPAAEATHDTTSKPTQSDGLDQYAIPAAHVTRIIKAAVPFNPFPLLTLEACADPLTLAARRYQRVQGNASCVSAVCFRLY